MEWTSSLHPALCCTSVRRCIEKIFFILFDMALFSAYILYKKLTSQKVKYDQFWLVVTKELLDGLVMLEYAR
jgi:hypothetical protein